MIIFHQRESGSTAIYSSNGLCYTPRLGEAQYSGENLRVTLFYTFLLRVERISTLMLVIIINNSKDLLSIESNKESGIYIPLWTIKTKG